MRLFKVKDDNSSDEDMESDVTDKVSHHKNVPVETKMDEDIMSDV